jgi:hypothetical protein
MTQEAQVRLEKLAKSQDTQAFWQEISPVLERHKAQDFSSLDPALRRLIILALKTDKNNYEPTNVRTTAE